MNKLEKWLTDLGSKYKAWKAKAPERRQEKLERLQQELEIQRVKEKIDLSKNKVKVAKIKALGEKQQAMPQLESLGMNFNIADPEVVNKEMEQFRKAEKEALRWK